MTEGKAGARPSQVTMAGWVALVASAMLVLSLFDSMSQVRSIEVREAIDDFLSSPPGNGLGLEVPQVVEILRVLTLLSGAASAAALVLAIYVLQRNNAARIGFTVAAALIMLTSPVAGGFLPVMIAFAAIMLWTRPARDWFAGRPVTMSHARAEQKGSLVSSDSPPPHRDNRPDDSGGSAWPPRMPDSGPEDRPVPPPTHGFGSSSGSSQQQASYGEQRPPQQYPPSHGEQPAYGPPSSDPRYPSPYAQQHPPQPYGGYPAYGPADPDKRPTSVTVAAWLTWVFAGLTTLLYLLLVLLLLTARDRFLDALRAEPQFQQLDIATDDLMALLWMMSAIFIFWCLSSIALAVLAYRRVNWARILLVVSASVAALFSLAAFPFGLLHTLAAGGTVALLFLGGAHQWYARKGWSGGQGGYGYPSQGYPSQGYPGPYGQQPGPYGQQPDRPRDDREDPPTNVW